MGQRLDLHTLLLTCGAAKVYFQPPENLQLEFPCIVYARDRGDTKFSDNNVHRFTQRYTVTVIDTEPDSAVFDAVTQLPQTVHNRSYAANNLNHDVFVTYF